MIYRTVDETARMDSRLTYRRGFRAIGSMIHTTIGRNSLLWLLRDSVAAGTPASADWLIDRDGTRHRLTRPGWASHHAGVVQRWWQRLIAGPFAQLYIGIELENTGQELCTWQQLDSLAELVVDVLAPENEWAFPFDMVGHHMVASPYGRRSDPTGFNWGHFMGYIHAHKFGGR